MFFSFFFLFLAFLHVNRRIISNKSIGRHHQRTFGLIDPSSSCDFRLSDIPVRQSEPVNVNLTPRFREIRFCESPSALELIATNDGDGRKDTTIRSTDRSFKSYPSFVKFSLYPKIHMYTYI